MSLSQAMEQLRSNVAARKYDVVVLGGSLVEQVMDVEEFPKPKQANVTFRNMEILPGGSGVNTAVYLSRLGRSCLFVDRWGEDWYGDYLAERLIAESLDISLCSRVPDVPTEFMVILTLPDHDWSGIIRSPEALLPAKADVERIPWRDCSLFHVHGFSFKTAESSATTQAAIEEARKQDVLVSIDASTPLAEAEPELMADFSQKADIVFANTYEASLLTGVLDPEQMARRLQAGTPSLAIVKAGAEGSMYFDGKRLEPVAPYPTEIVDTIGAGDALVAGTLCGLLEGMDPAGGLDLGSRTACLVISGMGAQSLRFDRSDVDALL